MFQQRVVSGSLALTHCLGQLKRLAGTVSRGVDPGEIGGHPAIYLNITMFQLQPGRQLGRGDGGPQQEDAVAGDFRSGSGAHPGDLGVAVVWN